MPRVSGIQPAVDLALLEVPRSFALPHLPLPLTSEGLVYSQEVLFLGFPYGLVTSGPSLEFLPFVKRAAVSASESVATGQLWYLDGINNPGFSGGSVVFARPGSADLHLMAVISGYRRDWQNLHVHDVEDAAMRVSTNSGIIIAYDIAPVRRALEARTGRAGT